MEYAYALSEELKVMVFDVGNSIVALFIEENRKVKWNIIARDYRNGLKSVFCDGMVYLVYATINDEIVYRKIGNESKIVLINGINSIQNIVSFDVISLGNRVYMIYGQNGADNVGELKYICLGVNREIYRISEIEQRMYSLGIYNIVSQNVIVYEVDGGKREICKIVYGEDGQLKLDKLYICNKNVINDLEEKLEKEHEKYENTFKSQREEVEKHFKNELKLVENQYISQYNELEKLAKNIQDEGKKWRDKYYETVKNCNKRT